jgi:hypothetical protein
MVGHVKMSGRRGGYSPTNGNGARLVPLHHFDAVIVAIMRGARVALGISEIQRRNSGATT